MIKVRAGVFKVGQWHFETLEEHLLGHAWRFSIKGVVHSTRTGPLLAEQDPLSTLKMRLCETLENGFEKGGAFRGGFITIKRHCLAPYS